MMMPNDNTLTDGHDSMVMVLMLHVINKTTTGNKWFSTYYQKIMPKKSIYLYKKNHSSTIYVFVLYW